MMPTKIFSLVVLFLACRMAPVWADEEFSLQAAEAALLSHDFGAAIEGFNRVLERGLNDSHQSRARLGLARAFIATGRIEEVPLALGRLTKGNDVGIAAEALLILGRAKYEAGNFDAALSTFRRVYELPTNEAYQARARLAAGWALWKLNRYDEIATEVAAVGEKLGSPEFAYLTGMSAHGRKDWNAAVDHLTHSAAESGVNQAPALFYLGESHLHSGSLLAAERAFQKLIDIVPESDWADDAAWGLARTAQAAGLALEFEAAIESLKDKYPSSEYIAQIPMLKGRQGVSTPSDSPGYNLFDEAVGHERDGRFDAAISAYHKLLATHTSDSVCGEALWRAARLHERLKQYSEAVRLYTQWLDESPSSEAVPEALMSLARIAQTTGKPNKAAKHYRRLVAEFPESPQAREAAYWLAMAAADEQKGDQAQGHLDWLLDRLDTDNDRNLWLQTMCLQCQVLANGQEWDAIEQLLGPHADKFDGGAAAIRLAFWHAEAVYRLGEEDAARRFNSLAVKVIGIDESWVPMVSLRRAQLAAGREDWTSVLELINQLDEKYPEFELAYECDYLRGRALAGRGEMSAARTAYGHVLENEWAAGTETAAMAQWMIGESHFHQQNYELAERAYQRVIERHNYPEWQARAALQAGKCAELSDNWSEAADLYADALERWQGSQSTTELSARLIWVHEQVARREAILRR